MLIRFFSQNIQFSLTKKSAVKKLIFALFRKEKKKTGEINFIFCNDRFLYSLNKKFLKHNTLTDIITFQYPKKTLSAEIYISIPRVRENAKKFKVGFENELSRVMIHGALHLCGYKDKTAKQKKEIRKKEDYYLSCLWICLYPESESNRHVSEDTGVWDWRATLQGNCVKHPITTAKVYFCLILVFSICKRTDRLHLSEMCKTEQKSAKRYISSL